MTPPTTFQPLYRQVYDLLTNRLVEGYWKPSDSLPSEMALADELGVSQGTVRKALNQMVNENLLARQQGKGTFVAEHTQESSLYRFFRLREPNGESLIPQTEVLKRSRRIPTADERKAFDLKGKTQVVELTRLRSLHGVPAIFEYVIQPLSIFPDIDKVPELPNSLYTLYQDRYGVRILSAKDELHAVSAPSECSEHLQLNKGAAVLMVDRSSMTIDGKVVEKSRAYCNTDKFVYLSDLR